MTTIYIVTSGDYSDYRIEGVFSNKEDAQFFADTITENSYNIGEIEKWELDAYNRQGINELCFWDFEYYPHKDEWEGTFHTPRSHWCGNPVNMVTIGKQGEKIVYRVTTRGATREEALKIANEKIMMAIAGGK